MFGQQLTVHVGDCLLGVKYLAEIDWNLDVNVG
jgi:hypothetical protein